MKTSFLFRGISVAAVAGVLAATPRSAAGPVDPRRRERPTRSARRHDRPRARERRPAPHAGAGHSHRAGQQPGPQRDGQRGRSLAVLSFPEHGHLRSAADKQRDPVAHRQPAILRPRRSGCASERHLERGHRAPAADSLGRDRELRSERLLQHDQQHFRRCQPGHSGEPVLRSQSAAAAQLRPAADRDQHRNLAQHAGRLVPDVHPQRPAGDQLGRAVLLGSRLRPREPHREARGPRHRPGAQPHHEDPDRRRLAGPDRHRPDRGRHRDGGAGHHHGRGPRRLRRGPAAARPQLRGREPDDGPRHPDRRPHRGEAGSSTSPTACGRPSRGGRRSSPRTTPWRRTRCATSTGRTRRCLSSTSWPATGRTAWRGTFIDTQTGQVISRSNWWDAGDQLFSENFKDWRVGLVFSYPILNRAREGRAGSRPVHPRNLEGEPHRARAGHRPQRARRPPRDRDGDPARSTPGRRPRSWPRETSTPPARSTTTA